jgi:hypothetical protein
MLICFQERRPERSLQGSVTAPILCTMPAGLSCAGQGAPGLPTRQSPSSANNTASTSAKLGSETHGRRACRTLLFFGILRSIVDAATQGQGRFHARRIARRRANPPSLLSLKTRQHTHKSWNHSSRRSVHPKLPRTSKTGKQHGTGTWLRPPRNGRPHTHMPSPPEGPDRQRGVRDVDCAFPDSDRSACLNDRPALSGAEGQCFRLGYALSHFCDCYRLVKRGEKGKLSANPSPWRPAGPGALRALTRTGLHLPRVLPRLILISRGTKELSATGWQIKPLASRVGKGLGFVHLDGTGCGKTDVNQIGYHRRTHGRAGCLRGQMPATHPIHPDRPKYVPPPHNASRTQEQAPLSLISLHQLSTLSGQCLCSSLVSRRYLPR